MIIEGNVITPDEGMTLTNGETYSKKVYLGIYDSPSNWSEIPDEDVPTQEEASAQDYEESLERLGVDI